MKRGLGDLLASMQGAQFAARNAWEQDVLPHFVDACRRDVHEDTGALGDWQAWLAGGGRAITGQLAGPRAAHQLLAVGHVLAAAQLVAREGRWSADDSEHLLGLLPAEMVAVYGRPFLRDLLRQLGGRPAIPIAKARVLFPLVLPPGDTVLPLGGAVLAQFRLDLLPGGTGEVFLDPRQAISRELGPVFAATFDQARDVARGLLGDGARGGDVRVGIEPHDPGHKAESHLQRCLLEGSSAGGALALGLWSLWQGMPLDTGLVVSFALAATGAAADERCHEVGDEIKKARGVLERGLRTLLLAAEQPGDVDAWGEELGLTVARAATLHEATGIASGLASDLRAYYEALIDKLAQTPWRHADGLPVLAEDIAMSVRVLKEEQRELDQRDRAEDDDRDRQISYPEVARYYEEPTLERRKELVDWHAERTHLAQAVVLGAPGGGKSFLAAITAIDLAREGLAALADGRPLDELPVPVHLDLADLAKALGHHEDPAGVLVEALRARAPRGLGHVAWDWIAERATTSRGWLILDALDQVEHERRPALHDWLEQVELQGWRCRALVTCRSANYERGWLPWRTIAEYELAPFEPGEVHRLVDRWFARDPGKATLLDGALDRSFPLAHACRSPLVASLVCLVHEEQALGDHVRRADLYPRALRFLLKRSWQARGVVHRESALNDRLWLLEHVAWSLFPKHPEVNQFPHVEVHNALQDATRELGLDLTAVAARDELLDAGVLVEAGLDARGESQLSFLHRSFLEFLAARALARRANDEGWGAIADLVDNKAWHPAWREVILFLAGQLDDAAQLLDFLLDQRCDAFHRMLLLAGACSAEACETDALNSVLHRTFGRLRTITSSKYPYEMRAAARALVSVPLASATEMLQPLLRGPAAEEVALAIGRMRSPHSTELLLPLLGDDRPRVRKAAVVAIGENKLHQAAEAIVALLEDKNSDVRVAAITTLGELGGSHSLAALTSRLSSPGRRHQKGAVLEALGEIRDAAAIEPIVEWCLESSSAPALQVQAAVAAAFKIDSGTALQVLSAKLSDGDPRIRAIAASVLGHTRDGQAARLLGTALNDPEPLVQASIYKALGQIGDAHCLDLLLHVAGDGFAHATPHDEARHSELFHALGTIGGDLAVAALRKALAEDGEDSCHKAIVGGMASSRREEAVIDLARFLAGRSDDRLRANVASALGEIERTDISTAALIAATSDNSPLVRAASLRALGRAGIGKAIGAAANALSDEDFDVKTAAIEALGDFGGDEAARLLSDAMPGILTAIREPMTSILEPMTTLIRSLQKAGGPIAVHALIQLLTKDNWHQIPAAEALSEVINASADRREILKLLLSTFNDSLGFKGGFGLYHALWRSQARIISDLDVEWPSWRCQLNEITMAQLAETLPRS
jgi:HEAT repeat protein